MCSFWHRKGIAFNSMYLRAKLFSCMVFWMRNQKNFLSHSRHSDWQGSIFILNTLLVLSPLWIQSPPLKYIKIFLVMKERFLLWPVQKLINWTEFFIWAMWDVFNLKVFFKKKTSFSLSGMTCSVVIKRSIVITKVAGAHQHLLQNLFLVC